MSTRTAAHFHSIAKAIKHGASRATPSSSARAPTRRAAASPDSSALEIKKDLKLVGAGADQVTVTPKQQDDNRIAADVPDLRSGKGDIVAVVGKKDKPIDVDISGITFDADGVMRPPASCSSTPRAR